MINIKDPQQIPLFDPILGNMSKVGLKFMEGSWQPTFRVAILEMLKKPVTKLAERFHKTKGRPTKELYSVAGLLLLKQFNNWTTQEAVAAYMFHLDVQFALNLGGSCQSITDRTIENYEKIFLEDNLAAEIMHEVTTALVEQMELDTSKQRLDSTHILSNMAKFGRNRMMGLAIKRFLINLKRYSQGEYEKLPEDLLQRYEPSAHQMFADVKKEDFSLLTQKIAEDLNMLITRFENISKISNRTTFKAIQQIFNEQCEIAEEKVVVKKRVGGDVVQNTSDMEATYSGHKGSGYQAQFVESCSKNNGEQLVLSAIVETASKSDSDAVEPVIDDLKGKNVVPDELYADTAYCGDDNVLKAEEEDIELIGPTPGNKTSASSNDNPALTIDDFVIDILNNTVINCPAGHCPKSSKYNEETEKTTTVMSAKDCACCEFVDSCIVKKSKADYSIEHTEKHIRLAGRRKEEATQEFKKRYSIRGGIEATNSVIKRRTGLSRLRVRGFAAVQHCVLLKVTGWNILRGSQNVKIKNRVAIWMNQALRNTFKLYFGLIKRLDIAVLSKKMLDPPRFENLLKVARFHAGKLVA